LWVPAAIAGVFADCCWCFSCVFLVLLLLASLTNVAGFSTVGNFPNDSGGGLWLTSIMLLLSQLLLSVSHVHNVPVVVGLLACWCRLYHSTFASIYAFAGVISTVLAVLRLLVINPAVACVFVVVGGHNFAVIPAVAY
jgi:hypothetical protein